MIPFFVADRPMSLRLLKGLPLREHPGVRIGIMAHANTTLNFQQAFRRYPCEDLDYCDAIRGRCPHEHEPSRCETREYILSHTIKMCDSGIFTREGAKLTYEELFSTYSEMGVQYGIMIDVFQDPHATLESAREALRVYQFSKRSFDLVGVAHGDTVEEYLDCYQELRQMGFKHIAIGGLLRRRRNTVRFPYVRSQTFMSGVLGEIRRRYPDDWLFALGCFHPSRLPELQRLNVWADYKGWIFQYEKRNEILDDELHILASNHLGHLAGQEVVKHVSNLRRLINLRGEAVAKKEKLSQGLFAGRRSLRAALSIVYEELLREAPEMAGQFRGLTTRGLLDQRAERLVQRALHNLRTETLVRAGAIQENIDVNRKRMQQVVKWENLIDRINSRIAKKIGELSARDAYLTDETRQALAAVRNLIERTERAHRFGQVRKTITERILALL